MKRVKLLTADLKRRLPPLYKTQEEDDPTIVAKFFTPDAQATWYILEGEPLDYQMDDGTSDWLFFGWCDLGLGMPELGYVSLSDLLSVRGKLGLPVERDRYFEPCKLSEVRND